MTAKEFVRKVYPHARVEAQSSGMIKGASTKYYLCWTQFRGQRLSEGKSESNAWVNAKKEIERNLALLSN